VAGRQSEQANAVTSDARVLHACVCVCGAWSVGMVVRGEGEREMSYFSVTLERFSPTNVLLYLKGNNEKRIQ